jgi:two-component system, cell cycle sensor histidine kinase and response regulator CckA
MKKETSCINSRAILDYLKAHDIDYAGMIKDLDPEIDGLENPERFLRDPDNWISSGVVSKLFERATRLLDDDQAAYKMGQYVTKNTALGFAQRIVLKAFWSIKTGLRHCQKLNDQWNRNKKVELIDLKRNEATVRLHWDPGMETCKDICQYNQGVYTYLPLIWGGRRLTLKEECCYFDGAPYCEYHLQWPVRNRFHEIVSRFFTSKSVLMDTIKEMEKDKKIIDQQNDKLRAINKEIREKIAEHKQAEEALLVTEKKYRNILGNMEEGYSEVDLAGNFTFFNYSIAKILGYSNDELMGLNFRQYTNKENVKKLSETFNRVYKTGVPSKAFGWEIIRKDGTKRYVEASVSLMRDAEGKPIGFRGIARDLTERDLAVQEKRKLQAQLQRAQKMEAIGTLAGGVAHDLNNVLSAQVSYPDLILMDLPEDSPLRKPILTIQKSGKKAAAIVQDLLTLARRGVVVTDVVNINQIINSYLKSPECENLKEFYPKAKIESNLEAYLLNIMGSPVHLSKTVMNLVNNAAEAMPDGGNIFISTESKYIDKPIRGYDDVKEGDYVILKVSDAGVGISSEDMERIFEPFYTKKVMGRSGTGLGMSVVWGTVKDHKGYIDVNSTEGKGTTFTLYFPVTRNEIAGREEALPTGEYLGKGESVLVVDDVKEQCEIASGILKKLGYSVTTISSGEEAVDYMKGNSADLLFLDMIMDPGIDGLETFKRILELHPGQKAIIASGFSETDRIKEAQRLGAGKYIKKPYTLEKIGMAVKEELKK